MSDVSLWAKEKRSTLMAAPNFAFKGAAGEILREFYQRDVDGATLSQLFKLYYKLRRFIPIPIRQWMQRGRNRSVNVPEDWYLPIAFLHKFSVAARKEADQVVVHPWPDDYQMASVLTHDVETSQGLRFVDRLASLEERHGLRSAWFVVPHKYKIDEGLVEDLRDRGHEVGVHGYNHDGRLFESKHTFQRRTGPINQAIAQYQGSGFRSPMVHRNLTWLQALNIDYDASCFDIDPFQAMPGGVGGVWPFIVGKLVELPYTLPQDHTLLVSLGESSPRIWIEKFDFLRRMTAMAMLVTHPDYLNTEKRLDVYRQYLEYVAEQRQCWNALPHEVAAWWRARDAMRVDQHKIAGQGRDLSDHRPKLVRLGDVIATQCGIKDATALSSTN